MALLKQSKAKKIPNENIIVFFIIFLFVRGVATSFDKGFEYNLVKERKNMRQSFLNLYGRKSITKMLYTLERRAIL